MKSKIGVIALAGMFVTLLNPTPSDGFQIGRTWDDNLNGINLRQSVKVRFCRCSWQKYMNHLPVADSVGAVKDVVQAINYGLGSDLNFVYDGYARKVGYPSLPATQYDPITNPNCADEAPPCGPTSSSYTPGYLFVKAATATGNSMGSCATNPSQNCLNHVQAATITMYNHGSDKSTLDHSLSISTSGEYQIVNFWAQGVLFHEFAHSLGWLDHYSPPETNLGFPWDLAEPGSNSPEDRKIWIHDFVSARQTPTCVQQEPYSSNPKPIRHFVTYDEGNSWAEVADDGNLQAETLVKPGAAWGNTTYGNRYVLAWAEPVEGRIVTIIGDGYSWYSQTRTIHSAAAAKTRSGLSLAYGNGLWVLAWTGFDDNWMDKGKPIYYQISVDAINWSDPFKLTFNQSPNEVPYGTLDSPVVRFVDYDGGRFILMFQNWNMANHFDGSGATYNQISDLSSAYACTSESPLWYGFDRCSIVGFYGASLYIPFTWSTPGLACLPGQNSCIVVGTDHYPSGGHHRFWNAQGSISGNEYFILNQAQPSYQSISSGASGWASRQELSTVYSGSRWLMGAVLDGTVFSGYKTSTSPTTAWGNKQSILTGTGWTAPDLVYAQPWWTEVSAFFAGD